jgi:hypothetical protein
VEACRWKGRVFPGGQGGGFRLSGGMHGCGVSALMLAGFGEQLW